MLPIAKQLSVVKVESNIIKRAKLVAAGKGKTLAAYLSDALRSVVDRDWNRMIRKAEEQEEEEGGTK